MSTFIFVYNANSGALNTLLDVGHKLLSPSTYNCNLCTLTFDTFTENKIWKAFREQSNVEMTFLHIDEFETLFPNTKFKYPIILKEENHELIEFLSSEDIEKINTVEELINEILKLVQDDTKSVT